MGLYATALAARNGGVRPNVINLGVSGETSSSFFGVGSGLNGPSSSARNTNYAASPTSSQDALMLSVIQSEKAAGHTISTVTLSLGANDMFVALAAGIPIPDALATFQSNEVKLLTQIRGLVPAANLVLLNYYDPYAPFVNTPTSPFYAVAQASALAIPAINQYIAGDAAAFGASYVDIFSPLQGHELADTYIATGNVHPNATGYQLIAAQLTPVPEPSTVILLGSGIVPILLMLRSQRRRAVA